MTGFIIPENNKKVVFCKDCKYFEYSKESNSHYCRHDICRSKVTGEMINILCHIMRGISKSDKIYQKPVCWDDICGPDGKLFEPIISITHLPDDKVMEVLN